MIMNHNIMMVTMCGLQGTGKTTLAKELSQRLAWPLLRTDVIRQRLFPAMKWTEDESDTTYDELFRQAEEMLGTDRCVILDATFSLKKYRTKAKAIAEKQLCQFRLIETTCSDVMVKKRLETRTGDESRADFKVYLEKKEEFEFVDEPHVTVDTSTEIDYEGLIAEIRSTEQSV
jgi:predicted kinase